mmetsp:Transcript_28054/g.56205  ORF Transcript_28054/g.56205 Transcript_28054/m.56205 type:complete len:237 (+) Transcript_28054:89-799(+)
MVIINTQHNVVSAKPHQKMRHISHPLCQLIQLRLRLIRHAPIIASVGESQLHRLLVRQRHVAHHRRDGSQRHQPPRIDGVTTHLEDKREHICSCRRRLVAPRRRAIVERQVVAEHAKMIHVRPRLLEVGTEEPLVVVLRQRLDIAVLVHGHVSRDAVDVLEREQLFRGAKRPLEPDGGGFRADVRQVEPVKPWIAQPEGDHRASRFAIRDICLHRACCTAAQCRSAGKRDTIFIFG